MAGFCPATQQHYAAATWPTFPPPRTDVVRRAGLAQTRKDVAEAILVGLRARVGHGIDGEGDIEPRRGFFLKALWRSRPAGSGKCGSITAHSASVVPLA